MEQLLERFLSYVAVETQAKPQARQVPSSEGQWTLARQLQEELLALGFVDVSLSDHCCVMGTLPANVDWPTPVIGFISHMDTSPDFTAKHVNPQIIENYRGGDIALGNGNEILSPVMFPVLHKLIGHTLITTDGKTLLGADDKAGIAEIMTAMAQLAASDTPHGAIRVAFTPDEEIGRGTSHFDVEGFAADWAYTIDGSDLGEFEYENFNAASATVKIVGNNVHPGSAKGVMVNALDLANQFHAAVPASEKPQYTDGYQGFYHLHQIKGSVEHAEMLYIIRDFETESFEQRNCSGGDRCIHFLRAGIRQYRRSVFRERIQGRADGRRSDPGRNPRRLVSHLQGAETHSRQVDRGSQVQGTEDIPGRFRFDETGGQAIRRPDAIDPDCLQGACRAGPLRGRYQGDFDLGVAQ